MNILNLAAYQFVTLTDLISLKSALYTQGKALHLKGTILLSTEGINISLAGERDSINAFKSYLNTFDFLKDLDYKESLSSLIPFQKWKVKIKPEIITFRQPQVDASVRAPHIAPKELEKWLDEKRDFILLDTRNDYEVALGAFTNAKHLNLSHFTEFPNVKNIIHQDKVIVMYCTGGVRCEKAAIYMREAGYQEVYQLDGGILNYFREVGGKYYAGECFVFDERISIAPLAMKPDN